MGYVLKAVLSSAQHPEYGQITVPFPIPDEKYDRMIELLEPLEIGDALRQDCRVDELDSFYTVLNRLVGSLVNFDELDYLAKRLDSFDDGEAAQFQGMACKLGVSNIKDFINLTFCCQQATVITDFSDLDAIGRQHYMTMQGGGCRIEELERLDGRKFALDLMQSVPREWLDFLRQQFPKDSRIQLTEIGGNPRPISPGSTGKLDYIDDAGQFHVKWDNGCTLALVLGEDRFSVYLPEPQTFKLYMPLTADFYGRDEWGDMSEDGEEWDGRTLMDYEGQILSALVKNRVPEENESGLMHWYGEDDSVDHKVRSAVFTVEVRNRQLWGVAECRVAGELTPEELTILKEYLGGQASDGWGEGFEQRPIEVDGGELYVHLWQPDDWSIQTEQERFAPKVAEGLPELCFSTLRTTGQLICIKRGETGYYPSDWDTGDKEGNVELADELNEDLGVTPIQRQAMEIGSMAGWDVPGADPKHYEESYSGQTSCANFEQKQ